MKKELRILILKDNPDDVELVVRELEKEEFVAELSLNYVFLFSKIILMMLS